MRVVRYYAPRDIRVEDAPEPTAGPGDLVIRVRNCSICGTDAKIWRSGHPNLRPPRVLGREVAGEVVEVGEGAGGWSVGDRVQVIAAIPDGTCDECRRGWMTVCPDQEAIGYHYDGGFAELLRVPAKLLAVDGVNRIPEGLHPGGVALYGFAADHETVIEAEAALVRYVADYTLAGAPMNQIVDVINWRGLRTREGKLWTVKTLRRILGNPYSIPILGQETHDKLVRLFGQPDRQRLGRPAEHLMSGILSCSRCGQPLYLVQTRQRDGSNRAVYACRKAGSGGRFTGCGSMVIGAARVDAWAEEMFLAAIVSDEWASALSRRQAELLAEDVTAADLDAWREEMAELEQVMPTRFAPPNAQQRHQELRRMVDRATARLLAQPDLQALLDLPRSEDALRARWAAWSTADRRVWLRRLVSTVVVKPATSRSRASSVEERLEPVFKL